MGGQKASESGSSRLGAEEMPWRFWVVFAWVACSLVPGSNLDAWGAGKAKRERRQNSNIWTVEFARGVAI